MSELEKLIEQYERENEKSMLIAKSIKSGDYTPHFVEWLASRPTCGVEQRKFLDKIEE